MEYPKNNFILLKDNWIFKINLNHLAAVTQNEARLSSL